MVKNVLFIERVGDQTCPTDWPLGEHIRICLFSISECHDKSIKYPEIFASSDVSPLNKIELVDWADFGRDFFFKSIRVSNAQIPLFELSCRTGGGIDSCIAWRWDQQRAVLPLRLNGIPNRALTSKQGGINSN